MSRLRFSLQATATHSRARAGEFHALHGRVQTPVFMPVGTRATVRGQTVETLHAAGAQVMLANTYHLLLRPGPEVFQHFGGIHRFACWPKPVLTDSGGYQIFCLPHSRKMTEAGAEFRSYVDGQRILLSPEKSISMQRAIDSDIMMVLDQCIPSTAGFAEAEAAMQLTHRWAVRSLKAREDSPQALFAITQGACFPELRKQSADVLTQLPFDGFAIGGLAVGESKDQREDMTEATASLLPTNLPRYLMGVGTPIDLLEAVHRGVDMFDCIIPTALAQQGVAFTSHGKLDFRRGVYRLSEERLDANCPCPTCEKYSRAYLHHLIKSSEVLIWQLLGTHNLYFYLNLMAEMRQHILQDTFANYYREKREILASSDVDNPIHKPKVKRRSNKHGTTLGDYELVVSEEHASIRQISSGETMHSVNNPSEEAQRLYQEQSRLLGRLQEEGDELILWDVGLGAATNAMSAVACWTPEAKRAMTMVSFENDLDSLRLALKHPLRFPYLRHAAPFLLVRDKLWTSPDGRLRWLLSEGDFAEKMQEAPAPDIIFYDPFSFKTDSPLWTYRHFAKLRARCEGKATELFTYSGSTAVRSALLAAGFFVGIGVGTGPKAETTVAFVNAESAAGHFALLGKEWLKRWERSGARYPSDVVTEEARAMFDQKIRGHAQFQRAE